MKIWNWKQIKTNAEFILSGSDPGGGGDGVGVGGGGEGKKLEEAGIIK